MYPFSVGWVNTIRYTLSSWSGNEIKFKPATFYLEVVSLCKRTRDLMQS